MKIPLTAQIAAIALAVAAAAMAGCSKPDVRNETVARVNDEAVTVKDLREALGIPGGVAPLGDAAAGRKKEALDRVIDIRVMAQEARSRGLDNTDAFRDALRPREGQVLISALFRKEFEAKLKLPEKDIQDAAKKLRGTDNNLPEQAATERARMTVLQANIRKIQQELLASARKETPSTVDEAALDRLAKGEKPADEAVLATAGAEKILYGDVKKVFQSMGAGAQAGRELAANAAAVRNVLDRQVTEKVLSAYAKKQGVEGSEWMKLARRDAEQMVLVDLLLAKDVPRDVAVSEKEIKEAYDQHAQMFVREGKKVPLPAVKEQLRGFLQNEKRRKALADYIEGLKKKGKISIDEKALAKA